ncbi:hypothetical protein L6R53_07540 [Myxococcota bacterium]|nr:hypothetical protein [Myxococcota bacterium]
MHHHLLFTLAGLLGLLFLFRGARRLAWRHYHGGGAWGPAACGAGPWGHHPGGHGPWSHGGHGPWSHGGHGPRSHGGHGPWSHEGRRGRKVSDEGFARAAAEVFKRRLRVDPDQEDIVDHALRDVQRSLKDLRQALDESRQTLAQAFAAESVDDPALAAAFARQDQAIARARQDLASAVKQVHAVLDDEQRARLVELLRQEADWR